MIPGGGCSQVSDLESTEKMSEDEVAALARAMGVDLEPDELAGIATLLTKYRQQASPLVGLRADELSTGFDRFSRWPSTSTS